MAEGETSQSDRPKRKKKNSEPKAGGGGAKIAIILAGVLVAGCCLCGVPGGGVGLGWYFGWFGNKGGGGLARLLPAANVDEQHYKQVQIGMTRGEVEAVLGPGTLTTAADVTSAVAGGVGNPRTANWQAIPVKTWVEWRKNREEWIFVGFRDTRVGELTAVKVARLPAPNGGTMSISEAANEDLAAKRETREKSDKLAADPKWVKGPEARKLLLGKWRAQKGNNYYEFHADNSLRTLGGFANREAAGTYRFRDDQHIEINQPDPFNQMQSSVWRFFVARDELLMWLQDGPGYIKTDNVMRRAK